MIRRAAVLLVLSLIVLPLYAQIATFGGMNGFGHSTILCTDRDGDKYGTGPLAVISTTVAGAITSGLQTITPASMNTAVANVTTTSGSPYLSGFPNPQALQFGMTIAGAGIPGGTTIDSMGILANVGLVKMSASASASATVTVTVGIGAGNALYIDTVQNSERVVVASVTSTTFTAPFAISHAAGTLVTDQGCLGPDADDLDPTIHSAADVANKYEGGIANTTVPHFRQKLANDILLANPGGISADTAAMVVGLTNPVQIYWLAPSTATPAGSDSNTCMTAASPCLTISGLTGAGGHGGTSWTSGMNNVLIFFRNGWDGGQITVFSGHSTGYTVLMSYPGEMANPNTNGHKISVADTSYIMLDGFNLTGGADIDAGTTVGGVPMPAITWHDNYYRHINATGPFGQLAGLYGFGQTNNIFEDSTFHDNAAIGSQHGIYVGSRNLASTNITFQRLTFYRNNFNGLHWNSGICTGCTINQVISYGNSTSGIDLSDGYQNSTVQNILLFDNGKQLTFQEYDGGQCPGRTVRVAFTGDTTNGSNTILNATQATKMQIGDIVSGPGIPAATAISNISGTTLTIGNNATATATGAALQDEANYFSGTVVICPNDSNNNLIQNVTIYASGADNYPSFNTTQSGCSTTFPNCAQNAINFLNNTETDPTNPAGPQVQAGNYDHNILRNVIIVANGKNNAVTASPIRYNQQNGQAGGVILGTTYCDSTCSNWISTSTLDHPIFWQSDGNNGTNVLNHPTPTIWTGTPGETAFTCGTVGTVMTVVGTCLDGNPGFADVVQASYYNNKSRYDFRLTPTAIALHSGTPASPPNYDLVGRAFAENGSGSNPSIGALERNLYPNGPGWYTLTGAGISAAVAPANGAPLATLSAAISTSSSTTFTVTDSTNFFVGNIAGIDSELVCINGVSGLTITVGVNAQCSGTASGNGRGWAGTTATTHSNTSTPSIYLNTLTTGGAQGTSPATYYQFQGEFQQAFTQGQGPDGVARDVPGRPKMWTTGPGGGHSAYIGNEIYAIFPNLVIPVVSRISGPSVFALPGFDSVGSWNLNLSNSPIGTEGIYAQLKDGTPNTAHIQSNIAYNSTQDKFGKFGGSEVGGHHTFDSFEFNFQTNLWERYNSGGANTHDVDCTNHGTGFTSCAFSAGRQVDPIGTFNATSFSGLATFDPITQTYWEWWNGGSTNSVLTQMYPAIHQHVTRASSLFTNACCSAQAGANRILIPDKRWIITQNIQATTLVMNKVDISGMRSTLPLVPGIEPNPSPVAFTPDSSCLTPLSTQGPGMTWNYAIGKLMLYPAMVAATTPGGLSTGGGGNAFWIMDTTNSNPANWTCISQSFTGGPLPPTIQFAYIDGLFQYFPSLDVAVLVNDVGANVPRVLNLNAPEPQGGAPPIGSGGSNVANVTLKGTIQ